MPKSELYPLSMNKSGMFFISRDLREKKKNIQSNNTQNF